MSENVVDISYDNRRLTEWLTEFGKCGDSGYSVKSNRGWLQAEIMRLKKHKVVACVIRHAGKIALFRLGDNDTVEQIQAYYDSIGDDAE